MSKTGNLNKTVIIFNGPIGSGKDTCAALMREYFTTGEIVSFKDELYEDVARHFSVDVADLKEHHNDRSLKETPSLMFPKFTEDSFKQYFFGFLYALGALLNNKYLMSLGYYSSREALIFVSECVWKPMLGEDHYGKSLANKIYCSPESFFFAGDGGFSSEIAPLLDKGYNVYIVKLERCGTTFEGDSRSYLNEEDFKEYSNIKFLTLENNEGLDELYNSIVDMSFDIVLNQTQERYGGIEYGYEIVNT